VYDAGDTHWRGGVVLSTTEDTVTIRYLAEQTLEKTADVSLAVAGTRAKGQPLAVRWSGAHTIVEVIGTRWSGMDSPGSDEAGAVDRALAGTGPWRYGVVPSDITGETGESAYWWKA
jgi:hypothetical protein